MFSRTQAKIMTLANQLASYSEWRNQISDLVSQFQGWLHRNDLADRQSNDRLLHLKNRLREDHLNIAFVAEFSRGKSELINAIFFADYGNRMLPSSAGRTTMCPTELMYNADKNPCIELLPIETRGTDISISDYKRSPEAWTCIPLNIQSADAMQASLQHVREMIRVTPEVAEELGFDLGEDEHAPFQVGDDGLVEIPRWRHATINFPHPLLKQGLVILDTPGLNAIGAEPELTISLLPNAHAILFILAADTGVTHSDLSIWKDHIQETGTTRRGRLVVMNKIDAQWDELKTPDEVDAEIENQRQSCANVLNVPAAQVFPVSAQKALVAKINDDIALLTKSRLHALETALSEELIPAKQEIVKENVEQEFASIVQRTMSLLDARMDSLREQLNELSQLQGKNKGVVEYMMGKIKAEKDDFDVGLQRYYAVRNIFSEHTNKLYGHLGTYKLNELARSTRRKMKSAAFSSNLSEAMASYFEKNRQALVHSEHEISEIMQMMEAVYKKFTVEHGLRLGTPPRFTLKRWHKEIDRLQHWCNTHINTTKNLLLHEKNNITQKFFDEIALQVKLAFEEANQETDIWLRAIIAPMETQVREHQIQLKRRLDSIKRIHHATDTLEDRIQELTIAEKDQLHQIAQLGDISSVLQALLRGEFTSSLPEAA